MPLIVCFFGWTLMVKKNNNNNNNNNMIILLTKSKKSPTGPTERTPKKPEYLIARSQLTERGPLGFGPIQLLMDKRNQARVDLIGRLSQLSTHAR